MTDYTARYRENVDERREGWASVDDARKAHYFRQGRSLCDRWVAWTPRWALRQQRGPEPTRGDGTTCKACWRQAPEVAPFPREGNAGSEK